MPFVRVRCAKNHPAYMTIATQLVPFLPGAVAKVLGDDEGPIKQTDVEVEFVDIGPFDITNGYRLQIMVDTAYYSCRLKNLEQRIALLNALVHEFFEKASIKIDEHSEFFVWIRLFYSGFAESRSYRSCCEADQLGRLVPKPKPRAKRKTSKLK